MERRCVDEIIVQSLLMCCYCSNIIGCCFCCSGDHSVLRGTSQGDYLHALQLAFT